MRQCYHLSFLCLPISRYMIKHSFMHYSANPPVCWWISLFVFSKKYLMNVQRKKSTYAFRGEAHYHQGMERANCIFISWKIVWIMMLCVTYFEKNMELTFPQYAGTWKHVEDACALVGAMVFPVVLFSLAAWKPSSRSWSAPSFLLLVEMRLSHIQILAGAGSHNVRDLLASTALARNSEGLQHYAI